MICSTCNSRPVQARGLCHTCYERARRNGHLVTTSYQSREGTCDVDGCDRPKAGRGLCVAHYNRKRKRGDVCAEIPVAEYDNRSESRGYVRVREPSHPLAARDGYVLEHRKVVHDAGIAVPDGFHVHHINGDKLDNRLENLEVVSESEHHRHHIAEAGFVTNQYGTWPLRRKVAERR